MPIAADWLLTQRCTCTAVQQTLTDWDPPMDVERPYLPAWHHFQLACGETANTTYVHWQHALHQLKQGVPDALSSMERSQTDPGMRLFACRQAIAVEAKSLVLVQTGTLRRHGGSSKASGCHNQTKFVCSRASPPVLPGPMHRVCRETVGNIQPSD